MSDWCAACEHPLHSGVCGFPLGDGGDCQHNTTDVVEAMLERRIREACQTEDNDAALELSVSLRQYHDLYKVAR